MQHEKIKKITWFNLRIHREMQLVSWRNAKSTPIDLFVFLQKFSTIYCRCIYHFGIFVVISFRPALLTVKKGCGLKGKDKLIV